MFVAQKGISEACLLLKMGLVKHVCCSKGDLCSMFVAQNQRSRESGSANLVTVGRHERQSPASGEGVWPCPSTARPAAPRLWPPRTGQRRDSQI